MPAMLQGARILSAPRLFDAARIAAHIRRRPPGMDFVTRLVLDDLADRLAMVTRPFERAAILSPLPALMPTRLASARGAFAVTAIDTLSASIDPEALHLPHRDYDLLVSLHDIGRLDDVPGFLARIRAHLRPDGLFLAATPGGDTLAELRRAFLVADAEQNGGAFTRVAPMLQLADAAPLLQRAGFALPVADVETHLVRHADPLALLTEIRALGASNPLAAQPRRMATRRLLSSAMAALAAEASDPDTRIRTTLQIVWLSGWAPDDSQQKPLRPGSAEISLKDVLGRRTS